MMGLISLCCRTQSRVFALSNSGTGLETQATSTVISHSHSETRGRTEILLAHFIHIMYRRLRQAYCMEMRNTTVDNDSTRRIFLSLESILDTLFCYQQYTVAAVEHVLPLSYI